MPSKGVNEPDSRNIRTKTGFENSASCGIELVIVDHQCFVCIARIAPPDDVGCVPDGPLRANDGSPQSPGPPVLQLP